MKNVIAAVSQSSEIQEISFELNFQEVLDSIKQISTGKAPGKDAIPSKLSKYGGKKLVRKLHKFFKVIWRLVVSLKTTTMP